jgi:hypothetical protein
MKTEDMPYFELHENEIVLVPALKIQVLQPKKIYE